MDTADSVGVVVDTRDANCLAGLLSGAGASIASVDADRRLGLTRWRVNLASAAAGALRQEASGTTRRGKTDVGGDLISALRDAATARFPGWTPIVDQDYDDEVQTNPHVKIARGDPRPFPAPTPDPLSLPAPGGPRVGVADAQVYAHDVLAGSYLGEPVTGFGPFPTAGPGHATFVAGTVLRRAPAARLVCVTVLEHDQPKTSWQVATKLMTFLDEPVDILNMSFGCLVASEPPLAMRRAMDRLAARMVLVSAIGNQEAGSSVPMYPAAFADVVGVGAACQNGQRAWFTPSVPWLDLLAPGVDVVGPFLPGAVTFDENTTVRFDSGYALWNGSSFAAAAVSGAIARRMQDNDVDAFAARDQILAEGVGDVVPYRFDPNGDPEPACPDPARP